MPLGQAVLTSVNPMSPGKIALYIIGMIAIIVLAYYATYFLGSRSFKQRSGRNIILRDRFAVSKDKSFYIIEAYGKTYIVGVTNHSMTVIDTLETVTVDEYREVQKQESFGTAGFRQGMINGMADFISRRILKRGGIPRGGDVSEGDFNSVYKKTMTETERGDKPEPGAEDEE